MTTATQVTDCGTLAAVFVTKVALCRRWCEEVLEIVEGFEDVYGTSIDEVENRSRDGFIPFTDGGFDGIGRALLSHAYGSGTTPAIIQPYLDRALEDYAKAWDEEHPEAPSAVVLAGHPLAQLDEQGQETLPGIAPAPRDHELLEKFQEGEYESLGEGGTYFYKVRVLFHGDRHSSDTGEPDALFCVGVNTDFEYGRDTIPWLSCYGSDPQCTKWVWEKTVKVSELTEELIEQMIKEAGDALRAA